MPSSLSTPSPLHEDLTPRERAILLQFAERKSDREIADNLVLSLNTVKWYARQIFAKLGVENRRMAVVRAQELGILGEATPLPTLPSQPLLSLTSFVGRNRELLDLHHFLNHGQSRLLTLVGPGGIGKTRLARQIAQEIGEQKPPPFANGTYFVALAALQESQAIVHAIAHAVNLVFEPNGGTPEKQLVSFLRPRQLLLVLDNFEQLINTESSQWLLDLLNQAPSLKIMVTSRSRLNIHGEQLYSLTGLDVPQDAFLVPHKDLDAVVAEYGALRLFVQAVRRLRPHFEINRKMLSSITRICRTVGGMPLAIELAASWIEVLSVDEIAAEVEKNLELLETDAEGILERQRSLRAVCDESWRYLSAPEQIAVKQMAIFQGGFSRMAAEAIIEVTTKTILSLVSKSWLQRGNDNRFSIHELLRQYCTERLAQDPPVEQVARDRHSDYYCKWLSQQQAPLKGAGQRAALKAVTEELSNIIEGFRWAAHHDKAERLAQATNALGRFFHLTDDRLGGARLLRETIAALPVLDDKASAEPTFVTQSLARVRLMIHLCGLSRRRHDEAAYDRNVEGILSLLNSPSLSAVDTRQERALIALRLGQNNYIDRPELAIQHFTESLAIYQALDDKEGMAAAQLGLGRAYRTAGAVEQAKQALLQGLAYYEEIDQVFGQSDALGGLATVAMIQGDFADAERFARQGLAIVPDTIRYQRAYLLPLLGFALFHHGLFAEAEEAISAAIAIQLDDGDIIAIPNMTRLAHVLLHQGKYQQTLEQIDMAHDHAAATGNVSGVLQMMEYYHAWKHGAVALGKGNMAEAYQLLEQALAHWKPIAYARYDRVSITACLALALRGLGRNEEAQAQWAGALKDALENRVYLGMLLVLTVAALFELDRGHVARAIELYRTVASQPLVSHSVWYTDIAGRELATAARQLPVEVAASAQQRGEKADLWQTGEQLADTIRT